jgi:hypothetical protein
VQQSKAMRKPTGKTIPAIACSRAISDPVSIAPCAIRYEIELTTIIIIDCREMSLTEAFRAEKAESDLTIRPKTNRNA